MKTSLIVKRWNKDYWDRAAIRTDETEDKLIPRYVPAHRAKGWNGTKTEWDEPESVMTRSASFRPKRGKLPYVRLMPDVYVEELSEIDAKRESLREELRRLDLQEQAVLKQAYLVSKPVTLEFIKAQRKD